MSVSLRRRVPVHRAPVAVLTRLDGVVITIIDAVVTVVKLLEDTRLVVEVEPVEGGGKGRTGGFDAVVSRQVGFHTEEHPHYVTDVHATIMRLMGLDARRLELPGHKRLEIDYGRPIREIIA